MRKLLPTLILGLFTFSAVHSQSSTISVSQPLTEVNLNTEYLIVDLLGGESFENYLDLYLNASSFYLVSAPTGVSIDSVAGISAFRAEVYMAFDSTDFDSNDTLSLDIDFSVLSVTPSGLLSSSDSVIIDAYEEQASISTGLIEADLDGDSITVTLSQETFMDPGSMVPDSFMLNNAPAGLTLDGIGVAPTSTEVVLYLQFIPGDFDTDSTNFFITIAEGVLSQSDTILNTNVATISSLVESVAMTGPTMNEATLDGQTVTLTLTDETFDDPLEAVNFALGGTAGVNYPAGLSVLSVSRTTATVAEVTLAFDGTDFDSDFTDVFYVTINNADLAQTSEGVLTPPERLTITSAVESATLAAPTALNEATLNDQTVTIDLTNETFNTGSLTAGNFTPNNGPVGLTIFGIVGTPTTTNVELDLQFIPGDFDTDSTNFTISIDPSVLSQSSAALTTNAITISSLVESVAMTGPTMNEATLDGQTVTLTLTDETFDDPLEAINFTLGGTAGVNYPAGLSILSVSRTTATVAEVTLAFDGTDFDTDFTDVFYITIDNADLAQTSEGILTPPERLTITSVDESATLAAAPALNEATLNDQTVTIDLTNETFNTGSLVAGNFTLNNGPVGLTIEGIAGTPTTTQVELELQFIPGDFDTDSTNFTISIDPSVLSQSSAALTTNAITISSLVESVTMVDPTLNEAALDGQSVTLTLTDETFDDPLEAVNFALGGTAGVNYPTGLDIESVVRNSDTEAVVNLEFDGTDFDSDFTDVFYITVAAADLAQTSEGVLTPPERLTITSADESATLAAAPALNEATLNDQTVTIDLNNETFNTGSLAAGNFTPNNGPVGLTIFDIVGTPTTTQVELDLQFIPGDFDTDSTNFTISIDPSVLSQSSAALTTNAITITSLVESVSMVDPTLNEAALDGQSVTLTLTDETFDNPLEAVNFALGGTAGVNYPTGLDIESVVRNSATEAVVNLEFDGTDFDADFTDFYITVAAADLAQTSAGVLTPGNRLTIAAADESATLTAPSALNEAILDGQTVIIDLINETFNTGSLVAGNFVPNNGPAGLTIFGIIGTPTTTRVELDLQFIPGDFDTDITNFSISIDPSVLSQSSAALVTSTVPIASLIESASMDDPGLNETALDGQAVTITLTNETFDNPLEAANFALGGTAGVDYPSGLGIESVDRSSSTVAVVNLSFDGTDFDSEFTDFYITIAEADLEQTSAGVLATSNRLTVQAYVENPVATFVPGPPLSEYSLNGRILYITLTEESFINPAGLVPGNFNLQNEPPGLSILSVTADATSAAIELGFDLTDFDVDYNDFYITIDDIVLVQSGTDLATDVFPITYGLEPVITGISIPNVPMNIGSVVPVTITVEDDEGNAFSLVEGGVIGNYPLVGLVRINETTYTSSLTITEGGLDYPASQDIHVIGIQLLNGPIPGNVYNGYIVQDNDELDANRPFIQYIYTYMNGAQNVGSEIILWVQSNEEGLIFTPTSSVNNIPLSSPQIDTSSIGFGRYSITYTVEEGDDDVSTGAIVVNVVAVDPAGNESLPTSIDPNDLSIDASTPVITAAYIFSTDEDISVGETIDIIVDADQPGYRNVDSETWINGVYVSPPHLTFSYLAGNSYVYSYTVQEEDGLVDRGELAIHIVLQDAAPFSNTSLPFTDLDPNNLQIVTSRPSAVISGSAQICNGESTTITVDLGGTSPWTMDIFDGTSTVQHTSTASTYTFTVNPEVSTTYTVTRVVDGTGNDNTGTGAAIITMPNLPPARILNLQGRYDVISPPVTLQYTPGGGNFTGNGISPSPWTFDPSAAGVSPPGSPHEIVYRYTDTFSGCSRSDTVEVVVVSGLGFISPEREVACFDETAFLITGSNVAGTTGSFDVQQTLPAGAFSDQGNNSAVLRPDLINLTENMDLIIEYTFEDQGGSDITIEDTLTIEYLEDAQIFMPDVQFCQNEDRVVLSGNYGLGSIFSSPGGGVVIDSLGNYIFDPALASLDTNQLAYEYTSPNQCMVSTSVELVVSDAPNAGFTVEEPCIPLDGGPVTFNNRSDTGGAVSWRWDFGDPASGQSNNMSTEENPTHQYENTGSYTVTLRANMGLCFDEEVRTIDIYQGPQADFSWSSSCFLTSSPTIMTGQETIIDPDTVSSWSWKIDTAGTEIFSSDTSGRQLSYTFPAVGTYDVRYEILTANGCTDTINKTISLIPTFELAKEPYLESFEDAGHGWTSEAFDQSYDSWTLSEISPDEFPVDTASGTHAWYTDRPDTPTLENSWVLSPCFSFIDFNRPMVKMDIKRSLHRNRNGASLQYTVDNGLNWRNVGDEDDGGIEWYNSTGITPSVGGLHTGWTGTTSGEEDEQWVEAAHDLDMVAGKPEVRFRVAFGSLADDRTETNDGFAFDNFRIGQRTRLSVLEYFTNANNSDCVDSDTAIMEIMNEVAADVIDIQYHARGDVPDKFFNDNNVPANSRGTIYGVTGIPYAVLDGNIMTYDFSGTRKTPNVEDIRQRSLKDPDFDLTITATEFTPALKFTIEIKALRDLERSDRTLYAIVLQKRIEDPTAGTNGINVFRHVARKMLPGAAGTYLGSREWSEGETENATLTYDELPIFPLAKDSLTIAVFMQDDETGEILQATTNPQFVVSTFDELASQSRVFVYPNPARDLVNVYFEESPTEQMQFTLYDLSGKMVITDVIQPWQQQFSRTLDDVEQGMYIVEIRNLNKTRVLYRDKLLHY